MTTRADDANSNVPAVPPVEVVGDAALARQAQRKPRKKQQPRSAWPERAIHMGKEIHLFCAVGPKQDVATSSDPGSDFSTSIVRWDTEGKYAVCLICPHTVVINCRNGRRFNPKPFLEHCDSASHRKALWMFRAVQVNYLSLCPCPECSRPCPECNMPITIMPVVLPMPMPIPIIPLCQCPGSQGTPGVG